MADLVGAARSHLVSVATIALTAVLWELVGRLVDVPFFPPLSAVLAKLGELFASGEIPATLDVSLRDLVVGYVISIVAGTVIGLAMGLYPKIEASLDVYIYALVTAPTLIFAPIFFSLLGLGRGVVIAVIVMNSIFYVIINTMAAVRTAPHELVEMARSYGANDWGVLRRVIVPAALPLMMAGYVLATPRATTGLINGELFIAVTGLGAIISQAGGRFDATTVLAVLLLIIVLSFIALGAVRWVERRVTAWLPATARASR